MYRDRLSKNKDQIRHFTCRNCNDSFLLIDEFILLAQSWRANNWIEDIPVPHRLKIIETLIKFIFCTTICEAKLCRAFIPRGNNETSASCWVKGATSRFITVILEYHVMMTFFIKDRRKTSTLLEPCNQTWTTHIWGFLCFFPRYGQPMV